MSANTFRGLFDRVSKRSCVLLDPTVSRHDGHELGRFAEQLRGGEMHGIERANRLHRKRASGARKHGVRHCDDVATALEYPQPSDRRALLGGRQTSGGAGTDDRSCCLCEGQRGGDTPAADAQRAQRCNVTFQQSRNQGA